MFKSSLLLVTFVCQITLPDVEVYIILKYKLFRVLYILYIRRYISPVDTTSEICISTYLVPRLLIVCLHDHEPIYLEVMCYTSSKACEMPLFYIRTHQL